MPNNYPDLGIRSHQRWSFTSTPSIHHNVLTLYFELSSLTTVMDVRLSGTLFSGNFARTPPFPTFSVLPVNFIFTLAVNTFCGRQWTLFGASKYSLFLFCFCPRGPHKCRCQPDPVPSPAAHTRWTQTVTAKSAARSRHIRFAASCPESQSILQDFTKPTEPQNILKAAQIPIHVILGRPLIIPGHVACMTKMYILLGKCRRRCSDDVKSVTLWTGFVGSGYFSALTSLRHDRPLQNSVTRLPTIRLTN